MRAAESGKAPKMTEPETLAHKALENITDVQLLGKEPLHLAINPADCEKLGTKSELWGYPIVANASVPEGDAWVVTLGEPAQ
jgi:hypothetical protein